MDSTPGLDNAEPDSPDIAPPWLLGLVIAIVVLGVVWILWSFAGSGSL